MQPLGPNPHTMAMPSNWAKVLVPQQLEAFHCLMVHVDDIGVACGDVDFTRYSSSGPDTTHVPNAALDPWEFSILQASRSRLRRHSSAFIANRFTACQYLSQEYLSSSYKLLL